MDVKKIRENITTVLRNKNTLTILLVFAGIIGLYAVYNWRVSDAISTVSIPFAKKEISSRTRITEDMISYTSVPKSLLSGASNLVTSPAAVLNQYVNYGWTIPQNSLFYRDAILSSSSTPESEFANIPDGYTVFQLDVDFDSTYGNSMYPGNYIDLYIKTTSDDDKIIFGKLIKGIKIMSVVDGSGNNVFESTSISRKPKYMHFAVTNDLFELLKKVQYINATIIPIPRNASYSGEERAPEIDSVYLYNFILAKSVTITN